MKRETLIEMLGSDFTALTTDEVIEIMEKELDKAPEDADEELIDLCLEVLKEEAGEIPNREVPDIDTLNRMAAELLAEEEGEKGAAEEKAPEKHTKIKIGKIFALVAVVAVLAAVITTVSADYFNIDASEKIVRFVKDRFIVNLSDDDSVDLPLMFEEHGLEDIVLPEVFYNQDLYKVTEFECVAKENSVDVCFSIEEIKTGRNNYITIFVREDKTDFLVGKLNIYNNAYDNGKQLNNKNRDVLVFQSTDTMVGVITYINGQLEYNIKLENYTFEEVLDIADTIK
ncbi:MAG: hypothetical protein IJC79_00820 [Clostridia bacterium]|nr:hypothetical protein [Clostridia bacterium]